MAVRIITGTAKGKRLVAPEGPGTRPATDRVREAVFSAIGPWVDDADVLDLYAGTGSYGLEALSRGAASATFVESDPRALAALRLNVTGTGLGGRVVATDVESFLARPGGQRYHLVFIDPPWDLGTDELDGQLRAIDALLEPEAEVVVSRRFRDDPTTAPVGWRVAADRRYGDARIQRYTKKQEGEGR